MSATVRLTPLVAVLCLACGPKQSEIAQSERTILSAGLARASGVEAWKDIRRIRFTWRLHSRNIYRRYDWHVPANRVAVTANGKTISVPADPSVETAALKPDEIEAHKTFVNDTYWLMFTARQTWQNDLEVRDLGRRGVPELPGLGRPRAISIQFPSTGGYTPGDRYILYLGEDFLPRAWSFHRKSSREPTLVTTWEAYENVGGMILPTKFVRPNGEPFISISGIEVR